MGMKGFMQQIHKKHIVMPNWSFKNIDALSFKKLKQSIKKNGQTKNIIVRLIEKDKYEIIDGRNVFSILKNTQVDYVYAFVYRDIDDVESKFIYLQNDFYFERNFVEVAKALNKINKKYSRHDIVQVTPYNSNEIEELLKLVEFDFEKYAPDLSMQETLL